MKKLLPLTGIRAIAAFWVVLLHIDGEFVLGFHSPFIQKGYLGVDLFFMLSGFIIMYVHHGEFLKFPSTQTLKFLILRCARILPVHYFVLFAYALLYGVKGLVFHMYSDEPQFNTSIDFLYHLLNIQAWGVANHLSWNGPAWSVSAEWFAYLLFPLMAPLIGRFTSLRANVAFIGLAFSSLAGLMALLHMPDLDWTYQYGLWRVAIEFAVGCSLFNLYQLIRDKSCNMILYSVLALLGLGLSIGFNLPDMVSVFCIAIFLFSLTEGENILTRFLGSKALVYLGEISYSIYMVHMLFLMTLVQVDKRIHLFSAEPGLRNLFVLAGMFLGVLLAAQQVYRFVELPSRDYIRSLLKKSARPAVATIKA